MENKSLYFNLKKGVHLGGWENLFQKDKQN